MVILRFLNRGEGGHVLLLLAGLLDPGGAFGHGLPCFCRMQMPFSHIGKAADFRVTQALFGTCSVMVACGSHDDPFRPAIGRWSGELIGAL